ncbi:MAG: DUF86 domain-containing protein [Parafilimonas sp.]
MSEREVLLLLEDMRDAARKILSYTNNMSFEDFLADDKTIDAVVRNFEIIGEAAKRIPENFKTDHPEIEWRGMAGLRNRIIHEYFGVDYKTVWKIKEENIPELIDYIQQAIESLGAQSGD